MLFVGGRSTMWGALVAAPLLWGFPQLLPQVLAQYANILYGALLIVVILSRPNGVISRQLVRRLSLLVSRHQTDSPLSNVADSPLADASEQITNGE
jgi:hypothetical protein